MNESCSINCLVFILETDCVYSFNIIFKKIMPWLRRLVVGLLQRKAVFRPRLINVRTVVDKVALERVPLRVLRFPLVTTIPLTLHTPVHFNTISTEGQESEARESNKVMFSRTWRDPPDVRNETFAHLGCYAAYAVYRRFGKVPRSDETGGSLKPPIL
jgi:hypothetical protein